ncbi:hypothetical protein SLS62_003854 [Diatrype stigma]|uniref:Uncharacterized protein n=1 Tax=Diatrype stigma TaxID=117547 RepID=A0AAN9USE0_9PEZI
MKPASTHQLLLAGAASLAAAQYTFTVNQTVYTIDAVHGATFTVNGVTVTAYAPVATAADGDVVAALVSNVPYVYTVDGVKYTGGPDAVHPTPPSNVVYLTGAAAAPTPENGDANANAPPAPVYTVPPVPELGTSAEMIITTVKPAAKAKAKARAGAGAGARARNGGHDPTDPDVVLAHAEDVNPEIHTVEDLAAPGPDATSADFPDAFTDSAAAAAATTGAAATGSGTGAVVGVNATATAAASAATGPGGVVEVSSVPSVAGQSPTTTVSATATATAVGKSGTGAGGVEFAEGFFPGGVLVVLGATFFYLL